MADKLSGLKDFIRKEIKKAVKDEDAGIESAQLPAVLGNNGLSIVQTAEKISMALSHEALFDESSIRQMTAKGTLKVSVHYELFKYGEYSIVKVVETSEIKTANSVGDVSFKLMPGNYTVQAVSNDRQSFGMAAGTVYPGRTENITVVLH